MCFSLDIPITAMWFFAGAVFTWSLGNRRGSVVAAAVYGLAFSTKLHAVFLPPLFVIIAAAAWYERREERREILIGFLTWAGACAVLVPLIYIGTQPWLWHDTALRIYERFGDYAAKATTHPIPVWFLGGALWR